MTAPDDPLSDDALLGGRIRLRQPLRGYRAGLDATLLAASLDLAPGERALEAGCGVGGALLQAAARYPKARLTGIERDEVAFGLAEQNVALNAMSDRVAVQAGDIASTARALGLQAFDSAFANPPFFDDPATLRGPAPERRGAWMADDGLAAWVRFLIDAVRPGGRVTLIHRADRLAELLSLLGEGGGSLQVRPIHPRAGEPAKRVLVRGVKGGRAPLKLLSPLVLHDETGAPSGLSAAIARGDAALPFDTVAESDRIKVRFYHPDDAEGLLALFKRSVREAAAPYYTLAERLAWAPDNIDGVAFGERFTRAVTWVAEIKGQRAGFIDLEADGHIDMLYVSADHQRRGVARVLYRALEQKARGQGLAVLTTEASLSARPFFEAQGFLLVAEQQVRRRGQLLTNFRMEKRLESVAGEAG